MKFFNIWKPLKIGNLEIRNRMVIPAMHLGDANEGHITDEIIEFYRRRAQGGFGFIIVGGIGVSKRGQGVPAMISIDNDVYIPELKKLTDAVHQEGAKVCAQLYHAGAYSFSKITGEQAVSASAVYSRFTHETPRELSTEEVGEVQDNIVAAAERAVKAGFDSVELLSSAGYLIDQFLSPIKNKRTDKYGGNTIQERLQFPLELIQKVKSAVGDKIIVGCRLSGDDFVPGSNTYVEKKIVAEEYAKAGIQYINVTGGWHETRVPQIPMDTPKGAFTYLAKEIRSMVEIPVFASNRINDPILAENLLQDDYADAICFGRASIADPDLPQKIRNDQLENVRKCVGCNQGCFDGIFQLKTLRCMVNPTAMLELKYASPKTSESRKNVVIIGSGPAGLEAARVAGMNGHKVILFEKEMKLGGQINVAGVPPGREDLFNIIKYYNHQLKQLEVEIHLGKEPTPAEILNFNPHIIICATGVHFNIPPIKGIDGSQNCQVCFADEALAGDFPVGKKVVVVGGAATGVETALWAAKKGAMDPEVAKFLAFYEGLSAKDAMQRTFRGEREVHLLEYLPKIGNSIGKSTKWVFLDELKKLQINVKTFIDITEFRDGTVYFKERNLPDGEANLEESSISHVDTFILATGVKPNRDMSQALKNYIKDHKEKLKTVPDIKIIGDAKKVGTILDAIHAGFKTAYRLGLYSP
ncbi:oxidoreductase [Candidatus Lokiarchaeum ossiferum]|uniref:oxidoreductase n=1 Tax=Candidatus Lokiarchaeum ossiferum TaxID=2951803 RepID=UPI00352E883C